MEFKHNQIYRHKGSGKFYRCIKTNSADLRLFEIRTGNMWSAHSTTGSSVPGNWELFNGTSELILTPATEQLVVMESPPKNVGDEWTETWLDSTTGIHSNHYQRTPSGVDVLDEDGVWNPVPYIQGDDSIIISKAMPDSTEQKTKVTLKEVGDG